MWFDPLMFGVLSIAGVWGKVQGSMGKHKYVAEFAQRLWLADWDELSSSFLFVLLACAPSPEVKVTEFPFGKPETKDLNSSINYLTPVFFWFPFVVFNALFPYITWQI